MFTFVGQHSSCCSTGPSISGNGECTAWINAGGVVDCEGTTIESSAHDDLRRLHSRSPHQVEGRFNLSEICMSLHDLSDPSSKESVSASKLFI